MLKQYPENRYESMLRILKENMDAGISVAIKGGATLAEKIFEFLTTEGIVPDCFLMDQNYFKADQKIHGKPVYIFEEYISKNKCILLIGHRGFRSEQILEEYRKNILYLFDYDFIGRLVLIDHMKEPMTADYLMSRKNDVEWLYSRLDDKKSENALDEFIYQKIYGNYMKSCDTNQYFDDEIITLSNDEVFIDCGSFEGETLLQFADYAKQQEIDAWKMIAFEPEPDNRKILQEKTKELQNIQLEDSGVFSCSKIMYFNTKDGSNSAISDTGDFKITVKSIDDVLGGGSATYIKMDVEGVELEALKGAAQTIRKYKPKLAVCIYHKREDFIDIPRYIDSLRSDYKFYIRNYDTAGIECVLYAI